MNVKIHHFAIPEGSYCVLVRFVYTPVKSIPRVRKM